jgi:hypothetical protein
MFQNQAKTNVASIKQSETGMQMILRKLNKRESQALKVEFLMKTVSKLQTENKFDNMQKKIQEIENDNLRLVSESFEARNTIDQLQKQVQNLQTQNTQLYASNISLQQAMQQMQAASAMQMQQRMQVQQQIPSKVLSYMMPQRVMVPTTHPGQRMMHPSMYTQPQPQQQVQNHNNNQGQNNNTQTQCGGNVARTCTN